MYNCAGAELSVHLVGPVIPRPLFVLSVYDHRLKQSDKLPPYDNDLRHTLTGDVLRKFVYKDQSYSIIKRNSDNIYIYIYITDPSFVGLQDKDDNIQLMKLVISFILFRMNGKFHSANPKEGRKEMFI